MQGYKTITVNIVALIFSLLAMYGLEVPVEVQGQISTAILAILNIGLRIATTTPVGQKSINETEPVNKQSGFITIKPMFFIAVTMLVIAIVMPGCSLIKEKAWQPFQDCANITEPSRQTLGACFVSAKILAVNIDAAADAQLITHEREVSLLDDLESAVVFLSNAKLLLSTDTTDATERLKLAQAILVRLSQEVPQPE
jgi:hypothetical protein